jgi:hypothetical protein
MTTSRLLIAAALFGATTGLVLALCAPANAGGLFGNDYTISNPYDLTDRQRVTAMPGGSYRVQDVYDLTDVRIIRPR